VQTLKAGQPAPPDYYSGKLASLLRGVASQYSDILSPQESSFIKRHQSLSVDAQRLHARLITRRGVLFRIDTLNYRELGNLHSCLEELFAADILQSLNSCAADTLLGLITKPELLALFPHTSARLKKAECIEFVVTHHTDGAIRARLETRYPWVLRCNSQLFSVVEILFFGRVSRDFNVFVLEDLGIETFEKYTVDARSRVFGSRKDLNDYLELLDCSGRIELLAEQWNEVLACRLYDFLSIEFEHRLLERVRRIKLFKLSREAERQGQMEFALQGYQKAGTAPSTERRVRIHLKREDIKKAFCLLSKILVEPRYSASEKMFASRFVQRNAKKLNSDTAHMPLKPVFDTRPDGSNPELNQTSLKLAHAPEQHVEQAVIDWYHSNSYQAWHTENGFIQAVFGLVFWEVIFQPVPGVFVNRYQSGPLDLYWPDFYKQRKSQIKKRLAGMSSNRKLSMDLLAVYDAKWGTANAFVRWRSFTRSDLELWLKMLPVNQLRKILETMLEDISQYRRGFPDLLVIDSYGCIEFVEVKGPGDQLSSHQRVWFNLFHRLEIPARVLRVFW